MAVASKLVPLQTNPAPRMEASDILTPEQLAERLQVSPSWIFEQTRQRAKARNKNPLPCIRLGKYLRFSWVQVCEWMGQNSR
jgi:predicted DNA-binding transcriptional regulator AlpA